MNKLSKAFAVILSTFGGIIGVLGYFRVVPNINQDIRVDPTYFIALLPLIAAYPIYLLYHKVQELSKLQAKKIAIITGKLMILIHAGRDVFEYISQKDNADGFNHIQRIVQNRRAAISATVKEELVAARLKINELIDNKLIDAFTTKAKEHILLNAMKEVIDLPAIESKLKAELTGAQNEINQLIIGRLFAEDRYEYFLRTQISIEEGLTRLAEDNNTIVDKFIRKILFIYDPELKQLFQPGYYKRMMVETFGVDNLTDLVKVSFNNNGSLSESIYQIDGLDAFSIASLFDVGGINEIISDTVIDIISDEIQNQAIVELLSWAGDLVLPGLSFIRLAYKSFRILRRLDDETTLVDCHDLQERVLFEIREKLINIANKSIEKTDSHFNEFAIKTLEKIYRMREKQNKILRNLRKYGKALGKEKSFYFQEDDPRFRMYYHYY